MLWRNVKFANKYRHLYSPKNDSLNSGLLGAVVTHEADES